jgi:hypothetical protein
MTYTSVLPGSTRLKENSCNLVCVCRMGKLAVLRCLSSDPPTSNKRMKPIDLTQQRFGKLLVLTKAPNRRGRTHWHCQCDCGTTCIVSTDGIRTGKTRSCGCLRIELAAGKITHGHARRGKHTNSYRTWRSMFERCYDKKSKWYHRYGGRGIEIDPRWFEYEGFYADMGDCPEGMSLERVHNNRNYWVGNCVWATQKQQARNTSTSKLITWQGQTKPVAEWAELQNIPQNTLWQRLFRLKWSVDRAMTTPPRRICSGPNKNYHED